MKLITAKEVASLLRVDHRWVLRNARRLGGFRILNATAGQWRFDEAQVSNWIDNGGTHESDREGKG